MNQLQKVTSFTDQSFDQKRMAYYQHYFTEYYHDKFRPGQGTEVILDMLRHYASPSIDAWLDVGAGPATLFWGLMLKEIHELQCSELYVEGLKVLDDFMDSDIVPQCYQDVMQTYAISPGHLAKLRSLPREYLLFDALQTWPTTLRATYDMITAFGVFGLTTQASDYERCFGYAWPALKSRGKIFGANWIRSQHFINQGNTDNRFMKVELIERAAKRYNYRLLHASREPIQGDPNYDGVIVWALQR